MCNIGLVRNDLDFSNANAIRTERLSTNKETRFYYGTKQKFISPEQFEFKKMD